MRDLPIPTANAGPFTTAEIARRVGGAVEGEATRTLTGVRGLEDAEAEHLSFLSNRKYFRQLATSHAGAVLIDQSTEAPEGPDGPHTLIRCEDPYAAFARALDLFHPQPWPEPGSEEPKIDERALVHPRAVLGEGVTVEAFAWVGPSAVVGEGCWLEVGSYVGANARLGAHCRLMPRSIVYAGCQLGDRVWLNPGVVVGGEGFGFAPRADGHVKIPQTGTVTIGDDVEIGANSCVDRATMGRTEIHSGAKLDNLVQVGHGTQVGEGALMAGQSAVAGSARLGKGVILAGRAGVINHVHLGDGSVVGVTSIVVSDQPAGSRLAGHPAIDQRQWLRSSAAFGKLPEMVRRLRALEGRVEELERELAEERARSALDAPGEER